MEIELLKKMNSKGLKAGLVSVALNEEREFAFVQKALKIVKDLANQIAKPGTKGFGLSDYLLANIEKYFRGPKAEEEASVFASTLGLTGQAEVAIYADMLINNVGVKTARVFVKLFDILKEIYPNLYEPKGKLLRNIRMDLKKAMEFGSNVLRDDFTSATFSRAIASHLESKPVGAQLTGDVIFRFALLSFVTGHNHLERGRRDGPNVLLNWNSRDPSLFEIEVKKQEEEDNNQNNINLPLDPNIQTDNSVNIQLLERLNTNFKKAVRVEKTKSQTPKAKEPLLSENASKICYDYAFGYKAATPEPQLREEESLDKQLIYLRSKLEKQQAEYEAQKALWKIVFNNSKDAVRNYRDLRDEINAAEGVADGLMKVIDKNTEEWRALFAFKNNQADELRKYKFFIAAILENCSQEIQRNFSDFPFAHEEDRTKMNQLFNRKNEFDIHEYLTDAYKNGTTGINFSEFSSLARSNPPPQSEASLVEKHKENGKKVEFSEAARAEKLRIQAHNKGSSEFDESRDMLLDSKPIFKTSPFNDTFDLPLPKDKTAKKDYFPKDDLISFEDHRKKLESEMMRKKKALEHSSPFAKPVESQTASQLEDFTNFHNESYNRNNSRSKDKNMDKSRDKSNEKNQNQSKAQGAKNKKTADSSMAYLFDPKRKIDKSSDKRTKKKKKVQQSEETITKAAQRQENKELLEKLMESEFGNGLHAHIRNELAHKYEKDLEKAKVNPPTLISPTKEVKIIRH